MNDFTLAAYATRALPVVQQRPATLRQTETARQLTPEVRPRQRARCPVTDVPPRIGSPTPVTAPGRPHTPGRTGERIGRWGPPDRAEGR